MGRRVLRRPIWGYYVCLCPIKGTPGLNELNRGSYTSGHFILKFIKGAFSEFNKFNMKVTVSVRFVLSFEIGFYCLQSGHISNEIFVTDLNDVAKVLIHACS